MREKLEALIRAFNDSAADDARIACLGQALTEFAGTRDTDLLRFMAHVALADSYSRDVRVIAYIALFEVGGLPVYHLPLIRDFNVPRDFDMALLRQFVE